MRLTQKTGKEHEHLKMCIGWYELPTKDYYVRVINETPNQIYQKLGQLEDIEEELGIDLITLFKALKNGAWFQDYRDGNIFYAKATLISKLDGKFECPQEEIQFKGFMILDQLWGLGHELKDYGKTWALDKNELTSEELL